MKGIDFQQTVLEYFGIKLSDHSIEGLNFYVDLLNKYQQKFNLISYGDINNIWYRHILDSLQLSIIIKKDIKRWLDIGSGGGFPCLVLAIISQDFSYLKDTDFILCESIGKKSMFLELVVKKLDLNCRVYNQRAEVIMKEINIGKNSVISARAVGDLKKLLTISRYYLKKGAKGIFPKGKNYEIDLKSVSYETDVNFSIQRSKIDKESVIIVAECPSCE